tara:strand:+ start:173 stop:586 length:414 start_codon:yes stop_codon:yes gene_type:complete
MTNKFSFDLNQVSKKEKKSIKKIGLDAEIKLIEAEYYQNVADINKGYHQGVIAAQGDPHKLAKLEEIKNGHLEEAEDDRDDAIKKAKDKASNKEKNLEDDEEYGEYLASKVKGAVGDNKVAKIATGFIKGMKWGSTK